MWKELVLLLQVSVLVVEGHHGRKSVPTWWCRVTGKTKELKPPVVYSETFPKKKDNFAFHELDCFQSSDARVANGIVADCKRAIDGDRGDHNYMTYSLTQKETNPYWQLEIGVIVHVHSFLFHTTWREQINSITDDLVGYVGSEVCFENDNNLRQESFPVFMPFPRMVRRYSCNPVLRGTFVKIMKKGQNVALKLPLVKVMGVVEGKTEIKCLISLTRQHMKFNGMKVEKTLNAKQCMRYCLMQQDRGCYAVDYDTHSGECYLHDTKAADRPICRVRNYNHYHFECRDFASNNITANYDDEIDDYNNFFRPQ